MLDYLLCLLKHLIAGEELAALERYRQVCQSVYRFNGQVPNSSETALFIRNVGEGDRGEDTPQFRQSLYDGRADREWPYERPAALLVR